MKFRKKPVVIEATRWDEVKSNFHPDSHNHDDPIEYWLGVGYFRHPDVPGDKMCVLTNGKSCGHTMHDHGWIDTLEGGHTVCPGDWIITGVQGEKYPIKPDIFEMTYGEVEESELIEA